jgi:5-oxopent-3-ene-1,2,5-tricarboxylate decarboxylase/2-hydroxyhepta-2,4-diene-1,7-dioate isomerase
MEHVAGYTIVNEFSLPEDSYYRPAVKAKCRDGFCPLAASWSAATDRRPTPCRSACGQRRTAPAEQHRQLVRAFPLIAEISEFMTLHAGDVLITGTPKAASMCSPATREVEIDGLGRLPTPSWPNRTRPMKHARIRSTATSTPSRRRRPRCAWPTAAGGETR